MEDIGIIYHEGAAIEHKKDWNSLLCPMKKVFYIESAYNKGFMQAILPVSL